MNSSYYSPASFTENSMNSDASNSTFSRQNRTPDTERTRSDEEESADDSEENQDKNIRSSNKKKIHRDIEARRRETEGKHIRELSTLIPNWCDTQSAKLPQLTLLKMAADLLDQMNLRNQYDPLLPSYLTQDEVNFLNLEASNSFLFITTIPPFGFQIIHVTDSIHRVLHVVPEQWLGHDLFEFMHSNDLLHVQSQLSSLVQYINNKPSFQCRLQQDNDSYASVIINGMIKKLDPSLKPVSPNEYGEFAFVGICHRPLTSEYSEKNMRIHQNPQLLQFSCRCSPNDWKIYLVDCSVSTFPSISVDLFRGKSILEFVYISERDRVHQHLLNSTLTSQDELTTCHFLYSSTEILLMILEIKPLFDPSTKRTDSLELVFKHIADPIQNSD